MASNAEKCIVDLGDSLGDPPVKREESLTVPPDALQGKEKGVRQGEMSNEPPQFIKNWNVDVQFPGLPEQVLSRWKFRHWSPDDIPELKHGWWPSLKQGIIDFTLNALPDVISWEYVGEQGKKSLSTWFPLAKDYIDLCEERYREDGSSCIYSAWIWHILLDCVFSPSSKRWYGDDWNSFGRIHSKFKDQVTSIDNEFTLSFYSWRSQSVQMLYAFNGDHVDSGLVKQTLRDHLQPSIVARGADADAVENSLSNIVRLAIQMDRQMLVSRADCRIEMCDPSTGKKSDFPFSTDETLMENDGLFFETDPPGDGARVDFVSVPSLRVMGEFAGGGDGDPYVGFMRLKLVKNYHLSRVNFPMQVVTDQLSDDTFMRWQAKEAEKERANKDKGECDDAVAENM